MLILKAENICKSYTEKILLNNISLNINDKEKIGIIGVNGTGKSTFLKIIAGLEYSDSGTITKSDNTKVLYLPQNPIFDKNISVLDQVFMGASSDFIHAKEYECKSILTKFGITDFERNVSLLSGGQKKRVALASVLVNQAEILILDEPTNHIDNDMVDYLEKYLSKYTGSILMVTHDRYFLDRVTNKIVEIENGSLFSYNANFQKYLELKAERTEMDYATARKSKSLFRKELEWMQRGPRARSTKSKDRIERFEELKNTKAPIEAEKLTLHSNITRLGKRTIEINNISKSFDDKTLIKNFSYTLLKKDRIGIIGANGCGKSTLLKLIMNKLSPDEGTITIGETVKIGYFSQETDDIDPNLKVIEYIKNVSGEIITQNGVLTAAQLLEKFLFPPELQWNLVARLSGGEKRRLFLLQLLMQDPNILIFDEPTNDLDIQTLSILENYLDSFSGAVIVVSHDRYFLDRVVDKIFAFQPNGIIKEYQGGYTNYLDTSLEEQESETQKTDEKISKPKSSPIKKLKFTFNEQNEFNQIDSDISKLENEIIQITKEIEKEASNYSLLQELITKKEALQAALDHKLQRWVYLNELFDQINGS